VAGLPVAHAIPGVPFVEQSENYCGPSSLAMVAQFAGIEVTLEELGPMMFTPGKKGTLQADFIGAARRIGLVAVPVSLLRQALAEVAADHPVVVMQNLGSSANPLWHYAVITGYDLLKEQLTLHSGHIPGMKWDLAQFERTWKGADYWALVAVSPSVLPVTASASELLYSASGLERAGKFPEAIVAYRAILAKWPGEVAALFGWANAAAAQKAWPAAEAVLERAVLLEPRSADIWNNLAEVYTQLHQAKRARAARDKVTQLRQTGQLK
jgi:tetratricopeptide (TPR) repeat protein